MVEAPGEAAGSEAAPASAVAPNDVEAAAGSAWDGLAVAGDLGPCAAPSSEEAAGEAQAEEAIRSDGVLADLVGTEEGRQEAQMTSSGPRQTAGGVGVCDADNGRMVGALGAVVADREGRWAAYFEGHFEEGRWEVEACRRSRSLQGVECLVGRVVGRPYLVPSSECRCAMRAGSRAGEAAECVREGLGRTCHSESEVMLTGCDV